MKNRKFKFFVPVSIFMFAMAAAFAFNAPESENDLATPGYIFKNNFCQQDGQCANTGGAVCTHGGMQLYRISGGSCLDVLHGPWQQ